jgi:hypothetical protein
MGVVMGACSGGPGIEVGLQRFDALLEPRAQGGPDGLLQNRAVEALDEAVAARRHCVP